VNGLTLAVCKQDIKLAAAFEEVFILT